MHASLVALTFALFVVASGCVATPRDSTPLPTPPSESAIKDLRFLDPVHVLDERNNQAETFIEVSADGQHILTCLHGEFKEPSMMIASVDGGKTFKELKADPSPHGGGDCEVAISNDGTWYFLHSTLATETITATRDQGRTWTTSYLTAIPTNGLGDRPWMAAAGSNVYLSYMQQYFAPGVIGFTKSTDHGKTWSTPVHATSAGPGRTNVLNGHMILDEANKTIRIPLVYVPPGTFVRNTATAEFAFAVSRDLGLTWRTEPVYGPKTLIPDWINAARAGDGTIYWPMTTGTVGNYEHQVLYSKDDGKSWNGPVSVYKAATVPTTPWIDGRSDGSAAMTFVTSVKKDGEAAATHLVVALVDATVEPVNVTHVVLGPAAGAEFFGLDHDAQDRAHVAFFVNANRGQLWYQRED